MHFAVDPADSRSSSSAWSPVPVPASRSSCQTTRTGHHGTMTEPYHPTRLNSGAYAVRYSTKSWRNLGME
jgi:hypothetical protein